jgi:hypothetical protein
MTQHKTVKLTDFTPDPNNANKGTQRGRGLLENSLQKLGAGRSVLADKNGVLIAGNKTLQTAVESGFENAIVVETDGTQLVVVKRTDLDLSTDAKAKELAVADNRIGEISLEWDADVLSALSEEFDLSSMFFEEELEGLWKEWASPDQGLPLSPEEEEENASDLIEKADSGKIESRVKLGEIWSLGRHRLCCGDSVSRSNIKGLIGSQRVSMIWSDPPYGINVVSKDGSLGVTPKGKYAQILGDEDKSVSYESFALYSKDFDCVQCWWGANHYGTAITDSSCWVVWDKQDGKSVTFADCELAWTNVKQPARIFKHIWDGFRRDSERGEMRVHPTQKPVALFEWFFDKYGDPSDVILDPFLGSGGSIIAAQQMEGSRTVLGFELSESYCEVILQRFTSLTGVIPELVGHL